MPNGSNVLVALTILCAYEKPGKLSLQPEHDEIWIGHGLTADVVSPSDMKRLEELGFSWDNDAGGWHASVSA